MRSARRMAALKVGHMLLVPVEEIEDLVLTRVEMPDGPIDKTICEVGAVWDSSISMAVCSNAACCQDLLLFKADSGRRLDI